MSSTLKTKIQYAGGVIDEEEIEAALTVLKKRWFGLGENAAALEEKIAKKAGKAGAALTNSGSSANLLAVTSMKEVYGLKDGDEVITCAMGFPTTVNPIIQNNLIPVFVDCDSTYNIDPAALVGAISKKTKAIIFAHTLGNPAKMDEIMEVVKRHNLVLIEDCCDALSSTYQGAPVGSFGKFATFSFYPAHHITMGEGGAVAYSSPLLGKIVRSYRDWGRDCFCTGVEKRTYGACQARFNFKINGAPYDHKYIFSRIGYNLKPTEIQAAIGLAQMKKEGEFAQRRKKNFETMYSILEGVKKYLVLPHAHPGSEPNWFSFPIMLSPRAPFTRLKITSFLEAEGIQTRLLFGGNLIHQPAYRTVKKRVSGEIIWADRVMRHVFMVGIYQGLSTVDVEHIAKTIVHFVRNRILQI